MIRSSWLGIGRRLSTLARANAFYTKTTLNPQQVSLTPPSQLSPKSLIVLSTPTQLNEVIGRSIDLHQEHDLQVVVAGVDSVVPHSHRNGISELWLDEPIKIEESTQLEEKDRQHEHPKQSDGIHIVTAKENWKTIDSNFDITLNLKNKVRLSLANTVFQTHHLVTLFYFQPSYIQESHNNSGQTLSDLAISLPESTINFGKAQSFDKWTPLYDSESEPLLILKCTGNLVKEINRKPAAKFLENNDKLMNIGSKDTQVFVKLYKPNQELPQKFEVIAGGGGWGAKANMLAISPEAKLSTGDRIEFFMLTPEDRFKPNPELDTTLQNGFVFECSYENVTYNETFGNDGETIELQNLFGCGSEKGFKLNNINFASAGERLLIDT